MAAVLSHAEVEDHSTAIMPCQFLYMRLFQASWRKQILAEMITMAAKNKGLP
jgi:hypothetical protein